MFHQVFVGDSISPDMEPEEPMETSHLEPANLCPDQAPSIQDYLNADVKLNTSFVNLTDVISHMMDDKSLIKDLEENFLKDSAVVIKKEPEEEDSDLCGTNVTYELVGRVKPETSTSSVKTETYVKEELHSSAEDMPDSSLALESLVTQDRTPGINFAQEVVDTYDLMGSTPLLITCKTEIKQETTRRRNKVIECSSIDKKKSKEKKSTESQEPSTVCEKTLLDTAELKVESGSISRKIKNQACSSFKKAKNCLDLEKNDPIQEDNSKSQESSDGNQSDIDFSPPPTSNSEGESDWKDNHYTSKTKTRKSKSKACSAKISSRKLRTGKVFPSLESDGSRTNNLETMNPSEVLDGKIPDNYKQKKQEQEKTACVEEDGFSSNEDIVDDFESMINETSAVRKEERVYKPRKKNWMCDVCGKCFKNNVYLDGHKNAHDNVRPYKCPECEKYFRSVHHMKIHVKNIHERRQKTYLCLYCGEKSVSQEYMRVHEASHNLPAGAEVPKPFKCSECDLCYETKFKLTKHVYRHKKNTVCPLCKQKFTSRVPLRRHMEEDHNIKREFKCPTCDKIFPDPKYLSLHKQSHRTVPQFFCDTCGKGFKTKHHVRQHLITHSDARPISCPVCDDRFKRQTHLKQHIAAHHPDEEQ